MKITMRGSSRISSTTTTNRILTATTGLLGLLALSACTVDASVNLTVSAEQIANESEDALEEQIGQRPEIDCGDDQIDLVNGTVVDCELTDPSTGTKFDTTVTLSNVDGTNFDIDVQVAEEPNG